MWMHAIQICKHHYRSVLFSVPFAVCCKVWRIKKNALFCTQHIMSVSWNIIQSDDETLTSVKPVLQSSPWLWEEMDFFYLCYYYIVWILWYEISVHSVSVCFFTMLEVAAVTLLYSRSQFSSVNHHFSADRYSGSLYQKCWGRKVWVLFTTCSGK